MKEDIWSVPDISLSAMLSNSIRFTANESISFFKVDSILCTHEPYFLYPATWWWTPWLISVNSGTLNTMEQVSLQYNDLMSSCCIPSIQIARSCGWSDFVFFLIHFHPVLPGCCANSCFHQQHPQDILFHILTSLVAFLLSVFLIIVIVTGMSWHSLGV